MAVFEAPTMGLRRGKPAPVYQQIPEETTAELPRIHLGQITTEYFHSCQYDICPFGCIFCRRAVPGKIERCGSDWVP